MYFSLPVYISSIYYSPSFAYIYIYTTLTTSSWFDPVIQQHSAPTFISNETINTHTIDRNLTHFAGDQTPFVLKL